MKKTGFFRGMFDGLRSTVSQPSSSAKALLEAEFEDNLKPSNFQVKTIVRHGFPYQPTAIAYDPIQRLIAIGTKNGSLRILGRPGVDISVRHVTEFSVLQIIFIINEGQLITICADDSLHLWNLRNKNLEIVHTLKFQKERITYCHMTFQSKWLYIGTERGNIYVVNIDTFVLSGYVINWNKAIELSRKTHPGSIIHLSDCPFDSNKLLIGYESGTIVLWDLRNKCADFRHCYTEGIQSISWHSEGRQFICSHNNGSLSTWTAKASKPASSIFPHSKSIATDYKPEPCSPIPKVEWRTVRNGDAYIMFSGGLPIDSGGTGGAAGTGTGVNSKQILTVIYGKSTTVLEMEHDIVDFITLCESPYEADYNDPYAIVVLLSNDLVVVDLQTPGYPCFLNPYPMDLHESPVTYCYYLADCPPDLVRAFFTVGHKLNKRVGYSTREWPINGGEWGSSTVSYPEIIITGHADGSLKFWDASSVNLQVLYKLKTPKLFEKPKVSSNNGNSSSQSDNVIAQESEDPFAIEFLIFSAENRTLCVAGACSQVIVFRFSKQDVQSEIAVIEVPMNYDELEPQADAEIHSGTAALLYQASAPEVHDNSVYYPLKARTGHHKRLSGFQAEIVCVSPWIDRKTPPYRITSMCHNVHASLLAYGTENSVVIIDQIQKSIVLNVSTSSLYGTSDPYPRVSGKQKRCTSAGPYSKEGDNNGVSEAERCRSPITESVNGVCMSPTASNSSSTSTTVGGGTGTGPTSSSSSAAVSRSKAIASVNSELKRSRSQGTRNKLQMMHTIHQSMMTMPSAASEHVHYEPERLINSSSINQIGHHHHYHHGSPLGSDKLDSFTRSRSSSMSSLENVGNESIQFLSFANTFVNKNDTAPSPTLWVGTSCGSVIIVSLTMPDSVDNRILCLQTVIATPSPTIFRLKGTILNIGFLDANGNQLPLNPDQWKDRSRPENTTPAPSTVESKRTGSLTITRTGSGGTPSRQPKISPTSSAADVRDSHFVVLTSEKQIRLLVMPLQACAQKATITETSFAVRADIVSMKSHDALCLAAYLGTGNIVVYSLPSLHLLIDIDFLPLTDVRIARTIFFSTNGHGMYLSSPSELTKFTISSNFCENLADMVGTVYNGPKDLPEQPKQSFLKGLFGGAPSPLDREELFGENSSGKASKTTARLIPGSMEHAKANTSNLGGEFAKLREGFNERGERLGKLEDKTALMQNEAEAFSSVAHAVMLKYRDKKWYQF